LSLSKYEIVLEQRQQNAALVTFWGLVHRSLVVLLIRRKPLQFSTVRILVVDDFEMFRQFVVELLGKRPELQVVGEASDGLEAIQKAVELRPDLILLDIGLPSVNGIEVARQMRSLVPESKIIFLTQESSADVVQKAFSVGARGYVTKNMALADLFAAVETVLSGMTFVSNP
jgi:DNA-binding NarL/FixJ family response regulator